MTYLGQHRAFATDTKLQVEREEIKEEFGCDFITRYEEPDNYENGRVLLLDAQDRTVFAVAWMSDHHADATLQIEG